MSLKSNNQGSIALAYNLVFHSKTKYINIQQHYICNKVRARKIKFSYIPTNQIIAISLTKVLTHIKFHSFIDQIKIT